MPYLKDIDTTRLRRVLLTAILAACVLACTSAGAGAVALEWEDAPISVAGAGMIAADQAGRVYVPIRGQGRVNVYDNARGGNRLLASIGAGRLQDPVSVAIDVRGYIYVADAAQNKIVAFSPYYWGAPYLDTSGSGGQALGQYSGLRQIATDFEPRIYATEVDNARVQIGDPARGVLTPLYAFGVSDPGAWGPISGIALDDSERVVVSSSDPTMPLRYYASNGVFQGSVAGVGSAPGSVAGPQALSFDPVDRLLVADTGNNRVDVFSSIPSGLTPQGNFGSAGSGVGQFDQPGSLAPAPGALLYVADNGNNRIVRLRYDDTDHDGAIDARDNCAGLANPTQGDVDSDGLGDSCDGDIDGDAIANGADRCPLVRPFVDLNNDGCQDPFSTLSKLLKGKGKSKLVRISGRANGGSLGIARVEVALVKPGKALHYTRAKGTTRWSFSVRRSKLKAGKYRVYVRAVQRKSGMFERAQKSRASFRIGR